jgi:hypothetical protein
VFAMVLLSFEGSVIPIKYRGCIYTIVLVFCEVYV